MVEGRGFLILQQPPTVQIGSQKALDVHVVSNTVISCTVPPGLGRNLAITVTPSARSYPARPGVARDFEAGVSPSTAGDAAQPYLQIAGDTTVLHTGFSYDGEAHLICVCFRYS